MKVKGDCLVGNLATRQPSTRLHTAERFSDDSSIYTVPNQLGIYMGLRPCGMKWKEGWGSATGQGRQHASPVNDEVPHEAGVKSNAPHM